MKLQLQINSYCTYFTDYLGKTTGYVHWKNNQYYPFKGYQINGSNIGYVLSGPDSNHTSISEHHANIRFYI